MDPSMLLRFDECRIDGRAGFYRYRQIQLTELYNALCKHKEEVARAVVQDTGKSAFEANLEYTLTLAVLKKHCDHAQFETLTERKRLLATGGVLAQPAGSVLIIGHLTAPLYSVLGPLSASILAGNVAVFAIPETCGRVFQVLSDIMYPRIDRYAYLAVSNGEVTLSKLLEYPFDSYMASSTDMDLRKRIASAAVSNAASVHFLPSRSSPSCHNICVVTDSCNSSQLASIAQHIARAKLYASAGLGQGALSFVCVHETLHNKLSKLIVDAYQRFQSGSGTYQNNASQQDLARLAANGAKVVFKSTSGQSVVEQVRPDAINDRNQPPYGHLLPIVPFTSTEEALKVIKGGLGDVLVVYGNALDCDYYQTEAKPIRMFANNLPLELLVGLAITDQTSAGVNLWPPSPFEIQTQITGSREGEDQIMPPFASWHDEAVEALLLPSGRKPLQLSRKLHADKLKRIFFLQGYAFATNLGYSAATLAAGALCWRIFRLLKKR